MPKVKENYIEQKRNQILDAAFTVSMNKAMFEVSMRDVITETGFSQGGIYRYFSNIDEIYIALINRNSILFDVKQQIDEIINTNHIPEKIISELFLLWKRIVLDNLMGVGKIYFELCTVYSSDINRLKNFIDKCEIAKQEAYFQEQSILYVAQQIQNGYFTPKLPFEDIVKFLATSFDGIIRSLILSKYYDIGDIFALSKELDENKLVLSLCTAFILLLNGKEEFIHE